MSSCWQKRDLLGLLSPLEFKTWQNERKQNTHLKKIFFQDQNIWNLLKESINVAEPHLLATKVSVKDEVVLVCLQKWNSGLGHVTQCLSCESSLHFPTSPLCSPEGPGAQGRSETMGSPCPTCMFLSYPLFSWTAWSKGQHNIQNSYIACKNKL